MDKKEAEQRKKMDTLNKAAQFLQAHYRGMLARREMERARKGKKGRKGRKKWKAIKTKHHITRSLQHVQIHLFVFLKSSREIIN